MLRTLWISSLLPRPDRITIHLVFWIPGPGLLLEQPFSSKPLGVTFFEPTGQWYASRGRTGTAICAEAPDRACVY